MRKMQVNRSMITRVSSWLLLLYLLQSPLLSLAQPAQFPEASGESLVLYSDREIYAAGERLYFHASYLGPEGYENGSWSSVLYVELISWDGGKQSASKVRIQNGRAMGSLLIPSMISSGNYYLRAYTLWMRNFSPAFYSYLPLKILNPYSREILAAPIEEPDLPVFEDPSEISGGVSLLSGGEEHYNTGENVELELGLENGMPAGSYSLGISKTRGLSSADYIWEQSVRELNGPDGLDYLPEINGLTLSGRVLDMESGQGMEGARLQLSSYADPFLFAEVQSREDGSFMYAFPDFSGNPELHIREKADSLKESRILLATEYCNKAIHLPFIPLVIDSAERSLVREILLNAQLEERYRAYPEEETTESNPAHSFYGDDVSVSYVSDYIELADLNEFITEIIPQVSIRSRDGSSFITVQGPDCLDIYPPLVLLDNIPVENNDELLRIPSNRIERIEVLNRAYMVGNARYSGIFSIYTNRQDMAGFARDGELQFFNLRMLDNPSKSVPAVSEPDGSALPRISNLLYWEPDLAFSGEGSFRISFTAPDTPGRYMLTLRSTDHINDSGVLYTLPLIVK